MYFSYCSYFISMFQKTLLASVESLKRTTNKQQQKQHQYFVNVCCVLLRYPFCCHSYSAFFSNYFLPFLPSSQSVMCMCCSPACDWSRSSRLGTSRPLAVYRKVVRHWLTVNNRMTHDCAFDFGSRGLWDQPVASVSFLEHGKPVQVFILKMTVEKHAGMYL